MLNVPNHAYDNGKKLTQVKMHILHEMQQKGLHVVLPLVLLCFYSSCMLCCVDSHFTF